MFKHRVDRMKKLYGDDDEGLLGFLALRLLAQIERPPLGAAADGVDRGEVEGMSGDARADGRQAGRGGPLAALGDDGIEPDIGNKGSSIREAGERAELTEQRRGARWRRRARSRAGRRPRQRAGWRAGWPGPSGGPWGTAPGCPAPGR